MKRLFDFSAALVLLVLAAPMLLFTAVVIRLGLGSPVLFRQPRTGRNGRTFVMCKFRTMTNARDAQGNPLPDAARLTPLGRWLRATSLDELPELVHVLRGEMSLVGPRPLLPRYRPHYSPRQARRHEVRPGITGWAQIHGRNASSWEERLERDVWYVEHRSLWLDLRILARTVGLVLSRRGVAVSDSETMPAFDSLSRPPVHDTHVPTQS